MAGMTEDKDKAVSRSSCMRILHINCNYAGTALHRTMIRHLDCDDVSSEVFCPVYRIPDHFQPEQNETVSVCFKKWDRILYFYKQKKIYGAVKKNIEGLNRFDVIHAYTLMTDGNIAYHLSKEYGIPYVVAIRGTDVYSFFRIKPYLKSLGIKIMRNASAVFFLSEAYRKIVLSQFVPERYRDELMRKSHVIPNGIDDFWLNNLYPDKDISAVEARLANKKMTAVCVGRINKGKNIPTVQDAIRLLRDKGWDIKLNVIGGVEDQQEYQKIIQDEATVYFPPEKKEKLIDFYRQADIFVLASHFESFGLVYAEALSQGLPVIYTRGQGFDGQFPDGMVGYAVSDTDPNGIAEAIERICTEYNRFASAAIKGAGHFNWSEICEKYRRIYRDIKKG